MSTTISSVIVRKYEMQGRLKLDVGHGMYFWSIAELHVTDGSIIPTALSVNPSATISALSERIAEHIAKE